MCVKRGSQCEAFGFGLSTKRTNSQPVSMSNSIYGFGPTLVSILVSIFAAEFYRFCNEYFLTMFDLDLGNDLLHQIRIYVGCLMCVRSEGRGGVAVATRWRH